MINRGRSPCHRMKQIGRRSLECSAQVSRITINLHPVTEAVFFCLEHGGNKIGLVPEVVVQALPWSSQPRRRCPASTFPGNPDQGKAPGPQAESARDPLWKQPGPSILFLRSRSLHPTWIGDVDHMNSRPTNQGLTEPVSVSSIALTNRSVSRTGGKGGRPSALTSGRERKWNRRI